MLLGVAWVADGHVECSIWKVLEACLEHVLEGLAKGQAEGSVLNNMCVEGERYITDAHGEILSAAYSPIQYAISSFQLKASCEVDWGLDLLGQVLMDDNNLRSRIDDAWLRANASKCDVDLLKGQGIVRLNSSG